MDEFAIRYNALMAIKAVETPKLIVDVPLESFVKSDWQPFPRKLKKRIKKRMLEINGLLKKKGAV